MAESGEGRPSISYSLSEALRRVEGRGKTVKFDKSFGRNIIKLAAVRVKSAR